MHEDEIVDAIVAAVDKALTGANTSRSFTVQTMLPGAEALASQREAATTQTQRPRVAPNYKVRMDPANRTLDSMVAVANPSQIAAYNERPAKRRGVTDDVLEVDDETPLWSSTVEDKSKEIAESVCDFTSIQELRREVRKKTNHGGCLMRFL